MRSRHTLHPRVSLLCKLLFVATLITVWSGCTEYWWTRGQPPSVAELTARAQKKLKAARDTHSEARSNVGAASEQIELSLIQVVTLAQAHGNSSDIAEQLAVTEQAFIDLDQHVSIGSRAALGELSGQLRAFSQVAKNGTMPEYASIGLFTARTFAFLANELTMPAPNS